MDKLTYRQIFNDGFWNNNVALEQMLALCPLLAVTTSATNGLGMGLATIAVMVAASLLVSLLKDTITSQVRIPVFIVLIATVVTLVDMILNAWMHELYKVLGLFIPLIVTNCAILGRVEAFASRQSVRHSLVDALAMGLGFTWVLVVVGAAREIIGSGTLFAHASLLLGEQMRWAETVLMEDYQGVLILALPPGGFLMLGLLLALKRLLDKRFKKPAKEKLITLEPEHQLTQSPAA